MVMRSFMIQCCDGPWEGVPTRYMTKAAGAQAHKPQACAEALRR